jgi:transcriptional regulator with XRE-family HTH domain
MRTPTDPPEPRTRAAALKLSPEEAQRVRVATRKVAAATGGFIALSVRMGVSTSVVYHAANPKRRPSLAFAVRLAEVAKVPVDALLSGKLAVQPAVIGVAA